MKSFIFSILFLSISALSAQSFTTINGTEKFIEVKVSDTLHAEPDMIKALVKVEEEEKEYDYFSDETEEKSDRGNADNEVKKAREKVEAALKNLKLTYIAHDKKEGGFGKEMNLYQGGYEVRLENLSQLDNLKKALAGVQNVSVAVMEAGTSKKSDYELMLVERLMKLAEKEAAVIAKSMGVTLDKPLNVSNQSWDNLASSMFDSPGSMGGMGALFSMMGNMFKAAGDNTFVVVNKSLVVRFGVK